MWTMMAILLAFYVGFFTASALAGSKRQVERANGRRRPRERAIFKASNTKVRRGIEVSITSPSAQVQASRN